MAKQESNYSDDFYRKLITSSSEDWDKLTDSTTDLNDSITIILKTHLFIEYKIDEFLENLFPKGKVLTNKFYFNDKLLIIKSTDLIDNQILDSIKKLNSVRNNIAHKLDYEVTISTIDKIGIPLGKGYKERKDKVLHEYPESEFHVKIFHILSYAISFITTAMNKAILENDNLF